MTVGTIKHDLGTLYKTQLRNVAKQFDNKKITREDALIQASMKTLKKLSKHVSNIEKLSNDDLEKITMNYSLMMVNHVMGIEKIK